MTRQIYAAAVLAALMSASASAADRGQGFVVAQAQPAPDTKDGQQHPHKQDPKKQPPPAAKGAAPAPKAPPHATQPPTGHPPTAHPVTPAPGHSSAPPPVKAAPSSAPPPVKAAPSSAPPPVKAAPSSAPTSAPSSAPTSPAPVAPRSTGAGAPSAPPSGAAPGAAPSVKPGSGAALPAGTRSPAALPKTTSAPPAPSGTLRDVQKARTQTTQNGATVITEPGNRTIVKQGNKAIVQSDAGERVRQFAGPNARTTTTKAGTRQTVVPRAGGAKVVTETAPNGQLVRSYRVDPSGRETNIIDNRSHFGRNLAIGVGIGALAVAAAVALAPPAIAMPRDKYIVEYDRASDDDLYDAMSAPPIERLDRAYSLEEVRYSHELRQRMRRIDLDVHFESGAWELDEDQYRRLERIADIMLRMIERRPTEVFLIEGHTDAVGSDIDNLTLSDRRAEAVADALTRNFGVPPENIVTQGYGEQYLKVPTSGPERANRRVAVRRITPLMSVADAEVAPPPRERYRRWDRYRGHDYDRDRRYEDRRRD